MKKKYVIFDFDGTMVNTNGIIMASWQATLEHYLGHRLPEQVVEATYGETLVCSIGRLIPDAPVDEVVNYYRHYQDTHKEGAVNVFDGVSELMHELKARGHRLGVATSRTTYSYLNYMKELGLEGLVEETVTMEDVTAHKPDPESLLVVLRKFDPEFDPADAIMIGDTKFDIGCANNAGVDSVLVGWSHYVDEEDLERSGFAPTYRINTPAELLELV